MVWDLSWKLNTALSKATGGALEDEGKVYAVHFSLNITLKKCELSTLPKNDFNPMLKSRECQHKKDT